MLVIEQHINKPIETVFGFLSNMDKFVTVHPVIYQIIKTDEHNYLIKEKLKILFFEAKFTYPTEVKPDFENKTIQFRAIINSVLKIEMKLVLNEIGTQTKVTETINFKSILPFEGLLKGIFIKHHRQLFLNIENT